jgi:transketolase
MFNDIAIMRTLPGMTVVAPADAREADQAIRALATTAGPAYIQITREPSASLFDASYNFQLGRAVPIRTGADAMLVSTGVQTTRVVAAAEILAKQGIDVGVLHLPTVKPLDTQALVAAAQTSPVVITVEEQSVLGGLGGAVAETLGEAGTVPVWRLGIRDTYGESGPNDQLLDKYRLSAERVAQDVTALLAGAGPARHVMARPHSSDPEESNEYGTSA